MHAQNRYVWAQSASGIWCSITGESAVWVARLRLCCIALSSQRMLTPVFLLNRWYRSLLH